MCGRFSLSVTPAELKALFGYEDTPNFPPRANVSPTEPVAIVTGDQGRMRFMLARWGFIPAWVKDPAEFPLLFNARGETMAEKPAFRNAVRRRRCIVPADGFYEWRRSGTGRSGRKEPFHVRRADGRPVAMGGLWETWIGADGSEIDTALVITTAANATIAAIHDRMPLVIAPEDFGLWLDCRGEDPRAALSLVRPAPDDALLVEPCDPRLPRPNPRGTLRGAPARSRRDAPSASPGSAAPKAGPDQGSLF